MTISSVPRPGEALAVDIELYNWKTYEHQRVSSRDADKIEALVAVLRAGRPGREHKCGPSGEIVFRRWWGRGMQVSILPGHDARFYEYRIESGIFQIDRAAFLKAMEKLGAKDVDKGWSSPPD